MFRGLSQVDNCGTQALESGLAVVVLLRAAGRDGAESRPDVESRQTVPRDAVLWRPANDMAPAEEL